MIREHSATYSVLLRKINGQRRALIESDLKIPWEKV